MAKTQKQVKLHGILEDGTLAKTHQAKDVVAFESMDRYFRVRLIMNERRVVLATPKDEYHLGRSLTGNLYCGQANGYKVHVTLKKIVGKVTYWS